ncbi:MAG TPA: D-alanyl-D-alanine carboxypeptidase [Pyrinomonadaceae bacterium]|jgi:D-alanyl-D-alanine carboxypeptidase/D-alanyl-D-alanine-endopeptidase (penicillin-binding protein 4)|nr:D-alanyl-D-alanine carboxypeptidase [Pyrinomonadaceae bacterium]
MFKQVNARRLFFITGLALWVALNASATAWAQQTPTEPKPPATLTRPTSISRPLPSTTTPTGAPTAPIITAPSEAATPAYQSPVAGLRGVLVETLDGRALMSESADQGFNPASAVKLATALKAISTFGIDHRFSTGVWANGAFDQTTGTINGDLIISGRDPSFHYEHAVMLARELNRLGIRNVTGDLIVAPRFTMNFDWSAQHSGDMLYDTLDATRRPAAAVRAWNDERYALGDREGLQSVPSVAVQGAVYVDSVPPNARMLLVHRSSRLIDVLKVLLCYSNNFMAERIGDTMGGPDGVRRFLISEVGISPAEVQLASTSGLGVNRVTPRAMMKIFRALRAVLAKHNLSPSDIMPVAGIDPGTLQKRYTYGPSRGSVIAKTGTLIRTDGGASALVGQMNTRTGETLLFVIFNQRGSVLRFRENQDALVWQMQSLRGGPAPFDYRPLTLAMRLADTRQDSAMPERKDEYEPAQ